MATIGLKIADSDIGGKLSLADTLAKGVFGDPEAEMKAKLYAAQIGNYGANTDFTRAKTKAELDSESAILAAGPAIGNAAAAAVPDPVAVEAPRADAPGTTGYGPQPGIVDPKAAATTEALREQERKLGPLLARGTPTQVAEGVNKNYGGAILSGAAGNPAVVSPDSLRIAGGLYTGSAPTTSTVWDRGDTSGVDAAAREKILEQRGAPQKPEFKEINKGLVLPTLQPDGTYKAVPVTGAEPQAPAPPDAPKIIMVDKTPYLEGPDGSLKPAPGYTPPVDPATPPYQGKTAKDDALNRIVAIQQKLANKQPITQQEAALYESDYNLAYGPTITKTTDPVTGQQVPGPTMEPSIPANVPPINNVRAAAGLPPNAEPTAAPPPNLKPTSPEQSKERTYATLGAAANKTLDTLTPDNLPSNFIAMLSRSGGQPGIVNALLDNLTPGPGRQYAQAVSQFIEAYARPATGATISAADYASFYQGMIPLPNDTPEQLAGKAALRHNFVKNWAHTGFGNDPAAEAQFLRDNGLADAAPPGGGGAAPPAGGGAAPPAGGGAAPPAGGGARGPDPNPPPPPGMRPEVWAKMPLSVRQHWND